MSSKVKKLTADEVKHVAKLARLPLTNEEISTFGDQLSDVISYIKELDEVDTSRVEPTSQTTGLENVMREDVVVEDTLTAREATSGTEDVHNDYFVVPLTLEERTV